MNAPTVDTTAPGELEYFSVPLVLKLTPALEQLARLRIARRDLTRELPPDLVEVVAANGRVQKEAAGEGADLLGALNGA